MYAQAEENFKSVVDPNLAACSNTVLVNQSAARAWPAPVLGQPERRDMPTGSMLG